MDGSVEIVESPVRKRGLLVESRFEILVVA